MGIKDFFKRTRPVIEEKASLGTAELLIGREYSYSQTDLRSYAEEGMMRNPTVHACIDIVSSAFARVPLRVYDESGEEITKGPLCELLDKPNPDEGGTEFRTASASWILLTGNCFTEKIMLNGAPRELWNWQPYDMTIGRAKGSRLPARYIWRKDMEGQRSWDVDPITGRSEMMHWRKFNPKPGDSTMGLSPMSAAAISADTYNSSMKWRYNQVNGGGVMDGLLSPKGPNVMDQKQVDSLTRKLKEKFRGPSRAGDRVGVGSVEMTYTQISSTMKDAEWLGGTKLSKQEICEVFKVPTQLIGVESSQTYANFEQATKALYYLAVIPLLELYVDELNRWLGEYFPGQYIGWSKSDIDALEPDRAERRQAKIQSGGYSINEIRAEFGDAPREEPEADFVMTNPSQIPLGMDVFAESEKPASDVAKALMAAGMPRAEAEKKALDWFYDRKD